MQTDIQRPSETVPFRVVQIIAAALIIGPLLFAAVAFLTANGNPQGDITLALIAVVMSAGALAISFFAPAIATRETLRRIRGDRPGNPVPALFGVFQTQIIIRSAVLEGAALLCGVAYMASGQWWTLAAMLVLVAMMAVRFPTPGKFDDWCREQQDLSSIEV